MALFGRCSIDAGNGFEVIDLPLCSNLRCICPF